MPVPGQRICIIGPSSSGKSTLAARLSKTRGLPVHHLDLMAHIPGTNWVRRPDSEFSAAHDSIIETDRWIIEGNYSGCMKQRFMRADTVIWLDPPLWGTVGRYIRRSLKNDPARPGRLQGARREMNLYLIKYTLVNYPRNRHKYREIMAQNPHLNIIAIKSMDELNLRFYNQV